jgi:hypothetical protein
MESVIRSIWADLSQSEVPLAIRLLLAVGLDALSPWIPPHKPRGWKQLQTTTEKWLAATAATKSGRDFADPFAIYPDWWGTSTFMVFLIELQLSLKFNQVTLRT